MRILFNRSFRVAYPRLPLRDPALAAGEMHPHPDDDAALLQIGPMKALFFDLAQRGLDRAVPLALRNDRLVGSSAIASAPLEMADRSRQACFL